jgi:hypothetical protein
MSLLVQKEFLSSCHANLKKFLKSKKDLNNLDTTVTVKINYETKFNNYLFHVAPRT